MIKIYKGERIEKIKMISYKYRIYPNQTEQQKLNKTLDLCRFTYNKLLEELQKQDKIKRHKFSKKYLSSGTGHCRE